MYTIIQSTPTISNSQQTKDAKCTKARKAIAQKKIHLYKAKAISNQQVFMVIGG